MGSIVLGGIMMGGMVTGMFVNAGLSNNEINQKCDLIKDLNKNIDNVHSQCDQLLNKFKELESEEELLYTNVTNSIDGLNESINNMKKNQDYILYRQKYIYTSIIITIITILLVKASLTIYYRYNTT
jgi:hypothetical protein